MEHLEGCAGCRTEVAELNAVWRGLETVKSGMDAAPETGAKVRFQEMLAAYQAGMAAAQAPARKQVVLFPARPVWQFAIAAGLLVGGLLSAAIAGGGGTAEMAQLRGQVESLHQMVALSMLQRQSPSAACAV